MSESGIIYEVTLDVDREIIDEFDEWLTAHVEEMLGLPGFRGAQVYLLDDSGEGRTRRVAHYHLESQSALDQYLADAAPDMRQSGVDRFGDQFTVSRRILQLSAIGQPSPGEIGECLNCGTTLSGQYCGNCGQRAKSRMISIWELLKDAFGDLLELDSRLWRSLIALLIRPGKLTRDYLEGRRARYMPPFRTYLVLSIVFFMVAFFDPKEDFGLLFEEAAPPTAEEQSAQEQKLAELKENLIADLEDDGILTQHPELAELREELMAELEDEGILEQHPQLAEYLQRESTADGDDDDAGINLKLPAEEDGSSGLTITIDEDDDGNVCDTGDLEDADIPEWLRKRLTPERFKAICDKVIADDGKSLVAKLLGNIPAGLIFLLPLMALALKMLYPLSKRYYVEHLLFFLHFHAFFFLILIWYTSWPRVSGVPG